MILPRFLTIAYIFFLPVVLYGQGITFAGKVIDAETGEPLPQATIALIKKSLGTTTDTHGNFSIKLAQIGPDDSVQVSYIGYKSQYFLQAELRENVTVLLVPETLILEELTFVGSKFKISEFMLEVAEKYRERRRKRAHISRAIFEQFGKINGRYAQYTICSGYTIYFGDKEEVSKPALYTYVPEFINKSFRRNEWLESSKYNRKERTDVMLMGNVGHNSYQLFEEVGPLSKLTKKYHYKLDSVYYIGKEEVFIVSFKAKPGIGIKARSLRGQLLVYANSRNLIRANIKGKLLWSPVFHQRVSGEMQYDYVYYNGQPFLQQIRTRYEKSGVEENTILQVELQKFNEFEIGINDLFDIIALAQNPDVFPDQDLTNKSLFGIDFERLQNELGFAETLSQQFELNGGKKFWDYTQPEAPNDQDRRIKAMTLMEKYKKYFR